MRYLLALLILLTPVAHIRAASHELHVWDEQTLLPTVESHYARVVVHPAGLLTLLPGSVLQLLPGAELLVHGALEARGTPDSPVVVRASNIDAPFGEVEVDGRADFEHVVIEGGGGIHGERISFSDVTLRDGAPVVTLTGTGGQYQLGELRFENLRQGSRMTGMGVRIVGTWDQVDLRGARFPVNRTIPAVAKEGLLVVGGEVTRGVRWPNQAVPDCTTEVVAMRLRIRACTSKQLPVLFVPGYGTSINLSHLVKAQASPAPISGGWGFISSLTIPYQELLASLEQAGVPFQVAYYDWRIPSEQSMREYLVPALQKLKRETGSEAVHVVAHSFGGILTQQYLVWDGYQGDVATATLIGTPSRGSPKAYGPWEGGQLPSDWAAVGHLIRTYGVQKEGRSKSFLERIRNFIPSLRELMPEASSVWDDEGVKESLIWTSPVQAVFRERNERLRARTFLHTVTGIDQLTYPRAQVGAVQQDQWEDGVLASFQQLERVGDGTVPAGSVMIPGVPNDSYSATHLSLVSTALPTVSRQVGVNLEKVPLPEQRTKWFVVDCPVDVEIVLPTGEVLTAGASQDTFVSEEATWLIVPEMEGAYEIRIAARADTEVRWWVDDEPARTSYQRAGTVQKSTWPALTTSLTQSWPTFELDILLKKYSFSSLVPWLSFSFQTLALSWLDMGN